MPRVVMRLDHLQTVGLVGDVWPNLSVRHTITVGIQALTKPGTRAACSLYQILKYMYMYYDWYKSVHFI